MEIFSNIIYNCILPVLEFFRHMLGNYGWAILAVTVVFKLVLLPLSIKQSINAKKSQEGLSKIKPKLDNLKKDFEQKKEKYKDDPAKLLDMQKDFQAKLFEMYKSNGGFNPLSGCLPMLAQFPILLALFWTFSQSPFQASIMDVGLSATDKAPTHQTDKTYQSKKVNFIGANGRRGQFRLETDIPDNKKLIVGESYNLQIKQISGDTEIIIEPADFYWNILASNQKPTTYPSKQYLDSINEATEHWYDGVIQLEDTETPWEKKLTALKPTDGKFSLEAIMMNDRARQPFLFIKDLGHVGLYDAPSKTIHWDMIILWLLVVGSFAVSSKFMSGQAPQMPSLDNNQEKIQKNIQMMLPLMFGVIFAFIPVPGAVFVYFLITNVFQTAQTVLINKFTKAQS